VRVYKVGGAGTLGIAFSREVRERLKIRQGDEFDFAWDEDLKAYVLIPSADWYAYQELSGLDDEELYERFQRGEIQSRGFVGRYVKRRVESYGKKD